ncbi:hypothetical protein Tco_0641600 [Tanacetum coccineum]
MNKAQDFKVGNLSRPDNRELGYIDAEMPKPLVHHIILIGQNGMHLLWDMKFVTKSLKCFMGKNTLSIRNDTHDGRKKSKNLTWKLVVLRRTVGGSKTDEGLPEDTSTGISEILGKPNIGLTYGKGYSDTPQESNHGVRPHGKTNGLPLIV